MTALAASLVNLLLLTAANVAQHVGHPPLSLCEEAAARRFGTTLWRAAFDPWHSDPVLGFIWTPAHEARLQDFSGKWVYISCIIVAQHWLYFLVCVLAEMQPFGARLNARLTKGAYGTFAFVHGLATVVMCLYCLMWCVATYLIPEWRAQWDFFEARGYRRFPQLMALVHLPSLAAPAIDILSKQPALLRQHTPTTATLVLTTTAFHLAYHAWLFTNFVMCGGAIPYPWYYDMLLSPYPVASLAIYMLLVAGFLACVVLGYGQVIAWRCGSAHLKSA